MAILTGEGDWKLRLPLPRINCYGNYAHENYGANAMVVEFGPITVWFSYRTPVAFQIAGHKQVVITNYWNQTTGKHLNWLESRYSPPRVSDEEFQQLWNEQLATVLLHTYRVDDDGNERIMTPADVNHGEPVPRKLILPGSEE